MLACLLLAACAAASAAEAPPSVPPSGPTETQLRAALKDAQTVNLSYRAIRTNAEINYDRTQDRFGRVFSEDIYRNLMTLESKKRLDSLFDTAKAALQSHDLAAASGALDEIAARLRTEANQYTGIHQYWSKLGDHWPDRGAYLESLRKNGLTPHRQAEIDALEAKLREQIVANQFSEAMSQTYPALQAAYRQSGEDDAKEIEAALAEGKPYTAFLSGEGDGSCSKASVGSGTKPPSISAPAPADANTYSSKSKDKQQEGRARVYVFVSPKGCVERALVTVTSGWADLDASALRWALKTKYAPAVQDSQPVAGGFAFWMDFKLKDSPALTARP